MPVIAHPFRSHRQAKGLVPRRGEREARRRVTEDVRRVPTAKRLARPEGLEPSTPGLEGRCSIQLSYGRTSRNQCSLPRP